MYDVGLTSCVVLVPLRDNVKHNRTVTEIEGHVVAEVPTCCLVYPPLQAPALDVLIADIGHSKTALSPFGVAPEPALLAYARQVPYMGDMVDVWVLGWRQMHPSLVASSLPVTAVERRTNSVSKSVGPYFIGSCSQRTSGSPCHAPAVRSKNPGDHPRSSGVVDSALQAMECTTTTTSTSDADRPVGIRNVRRPLAWI